MRVGDYYTAVKYFSQYSSKKPNNTEIIVVMADLYTANRDYKKAALNYLRAYHQEPDKYKKSLYYYGVMTKMLGNYKTAIDSLKRFIKIYRDEDDYRQFKKFANTEIDGCNMALALINDMIGNKVEVVLLDKSINMAHVEMSPQYLSTDTIIYASLKAKKLEYYNLKDSANWPVRKFYVATRDGDNWVASKEFEGPFNQNGVNTSNGSFSPDGNRFYFNRCNMYKVNKVNCELFVSEKVNGEWQTPEKLPEHVNLPNYTTTQSTVGISDKPDSEIIYFSSNRSEGKGGMDIWYTVYDTVDNEYSNPKNLGRRINSERNEITPFIDYERNILYFSSDGLIGLGGYDIYKSALVDGRFNYPVNLGIPINSNTDDLYYIIHKNQHEGFFVSNRENELNVKSKTCCDDIYAFNSSSNIRFLITGLVQEDMDNILVRYNQNQVLRINRSVEKVRNKMPEKLSNIIVYLYSIDRYTMESFYFLTDTTDEKGEFQFELQSNKDFLLRVNEHGIFSVEHAFNTYNYEKVKIRVDTSLIAVPDKPYIIENILFEEDNTELTSKTKSIIDSTLLWILEEIPHIIIDLSHQAKDKDPDISQLRTQNIIDYLISKGISENRLYDNSYFVASLLESDMETDALNKTIKTNSKGFIEFNIIGKIYLREE